ncbi:hypothetical protein EJB05_07776, partial [Eragrostis curvula]
MSHFTVIYKVVLYKAGRGWNTSEYHQDKDTIDDNENDSSALMVSGSRNSTNGVLPLHNGREVISISLVPDDSIASLRGKEW